VCDGGVGGGRGGSWSLRVVEDKAEVSGVDVARDTLRNSQKSAM